MQIKNIQELIDNKLQPNVAEWAMDVEDILIEMNALSQEAKDCLKTVKSQPISWHQSFPEKSDILVAILKRIIKKIESENVVMVKENVFIVYSHQHKDIMLDIKDFIRDNLGFEPKILDIAECTGSVWDAFAEKSEECQKAVVIMADDDSVKDANGNEYMQARPNVFIELGYMIHKCGLKNVTIVCSENCNIPSDIGGLISVRYKSEKWTEALRKQLDR